MTSFRASPSELGGRRIAFLVAVLVTLGLAAFFGLVVWQPALFGALVGQETGGHISLHFREPHHRIHDLTFALLLGTAVVGMVAQLRAPSKNVAGQAMALIPFIGLVLAVVLTNAWVLSIPWVVVGASTLLAATLHPAGPSAFRSFSVSRVNPLMLAFVVIGAVPLLAFAFANIVLQRAGPSDHALLGHYGYLAAFGFTVLGVGLLASLRPDGWRLTAWVAGLLPALLGLASLGFPDVDSSLDPLWALAAIAWGALFVAAAELGRRRTEKAQTIDRLRYVSGETSDGVGVGADRGSTAGTPRSAYAVGIIVVALVALFVVQHLIGGGLGGLHTPPPGP
jgi:hypothetical protein